MKLSEYLKESAKKLATELADQYNLPYTVENSLLGRLALRDAEILAQIDIEGKEEGDTLPPEAEKDNEVTRVDNSL
jgi:hypothetical protein